MHQPLTLPWAGLMIAAASGILLALAGIPALYIIAILVVWSLSLMIRQPPVQEVQSGRKPEGLSRRNLAGMIEHAHSPLLLVDRKRVVIANGTARSLLGQHVIGQDIRVAIRHPHAIQLMNSDQHGEAIVTGLVRRKDVWRVSRFAVDERTSIVELTSKTAESDVSRAHTDFVANASHELRTPLASIIGYVETLSEHPEDIDEETARKFLDTIHREAQRLQNLVSDLMSLSRIEAEKHDRPDVPVDLNEIVARAAHEGAGPTRADRLQYDEEGKFRVLGDPQQLEQLVRNLVDNALKYGRPDSMVAVRLSESALGEAKLEVEDSGDGIEPEHLPHLTRRFYRTDPGRSRMSGGTGLGLAIVKHIVERHHGRFDIASEVGRGTTVTVRLPREADPVSATPSPSDEPVAQAPGQQTS